VAVGKSSLLGVLKRGRVFYLKSVQFYQTAEVPPNAGRFRKVAREVERRHLPKRILRLGGESESGKNRRKIKSRKKREVHSSVLLRRKNGEKHTGVGTGVMCSASRTARIDDTCLGMSSGARTHGECTVEAGAEVSKIKQRAGGGSGHVPRRDCRVQGH